MNMKQTKQPLRQSLPILLYIVFSMAAFAVILLIPATREWFGKATTAQPYLMGFVKFALLATAGELIAVRMSSGEWKLPPYIIARFIIWGIIGIWITYMMKIFGAGVTVLTGISGEGVSFWSRLLRAFLISATMNICFGPTFMAVHKCSDTYLAMRALKTPELTVSKVIEAVDWKRFVTFTIFKTVPLFWIPAHTLTFLLPAQYQVMMAAFLSVALGIILNLRKKTKSEKSEKTEANVNQ